MTSFVSLLFLMSAAMGADGVSIRDQRAAGKQDAVYLESRKAYGTLLDEVLAAGRDAQENAAELGDFNTALIARLGEIVETRSTSNEVGGLRPRNVSMADFMEGFIRYLAVHATDPGARGTGAAVDPFRTNGQAIDAANNAMEGGAPRTNDLELVFIAAWLAADVRGAAMAPLPSRVEYKDKLEQFSIIGGVPVSFFAGFIPALLGVLDGGDIMGGASVALGVVVGASTAMGIMWNHVHRLRKFDSVTVPAQLKVQADNLVAGMDIFFAELTKGKAARSAVGEGVRPLILAKDTSSARRRFCALMLEADKQKAAETSHAGGELLEGAVPVVEEAPAAETVAPEQAPAGTLVQSLTRRY